MKTFFPRKGSKWNILCLYVNTGKIMNEKSIMSTKIFKWWWISHSIHWYPVTFRCDQHFRYLNMRKIPPLPWVLYASLATRPGTSSIEKVQEYSKSHLPKWVITKIFKSPRRSAKYFITKRYTEGKYLNGRCWHNLKMFLKR